MAIIITTGLAAKVSHRFWPKVDKVSGAPCWLWTGAKLRHGYGSITIRSGGRGHCVPAHRLSYVLHHGEIPEGLIVRHKCDVTGCVNPAHLEIGTQSDNMRDRSERGRAPDQRGEAAPSGKLREDEARQIIDLLALPNGPTQKEIAECFGVSQYTISLIKRGINWSHLERPAVLMRPADGRGLNPKHSKLTEGDVRQIRQMLRDGHARVNVAQQFGVALGTIRQIHLGHTWQHVA